MGLFDGGIPKGVQFVLMNLFRDAAPQLMENVDGVRALVQDFKTQLDRIEAKFDAKFLEDKTEKNYAGHGSGEHGNSANPIGIEGTLGSTGKSPGE